MLISHLAWFILDGSLKVWIIYILRECLFHLFLHWRFSVCLKNAIAILLLLFK